MGAGQVEKLRKRKLIAFTTWLFAQLIWVPVALIPVLMNVPSAGAISILLALVAIRSMLSAITNCAWSSWIRDLLPQSIMGTFLSRRLAFANVAAIVFGLGAAFFVDYWKGQASPDSQALGYTFPLLFGAVTLGIASPMFMSRMPEPTMQNTPGRQPSLLSTISTPFRDDNYRHLMRFLFMWGLAINLATPFFAVYMLQRLGLPLTVVIAFGVLGQVTNVLFLRVWGPLTDRVGSKAVLSVCVSLYLLVVLGWTFTTMPERYFFTIPLLVILHILAGAAAAGVSLTTGTIGLKLAPHGRATAYLAGAALALNMGAGLGPLLGGRLADFFSIRTLSLDFTWVDPTGTFVLPALNLTGYDFLFGITFLLGFITLNALSVLREEGEVGREVVLDSLFASTRDLARPLSTVPGLAFLSQFPYGFLRRIPLPGLDVALGVTAYQVAEAARVSTRVAAGVRGAPSRIAEALEDTVSKIWRTGEGVSRHGAEVAAQSIRGAIHAASETAADVGEISRQAMLGIQRALIRPEVDSHDTLRGLGHGVIQGAFESRTDLDQAIAQAFESTHELARMSRLPQSQVKMVLAEGMMQAASGLGSSVEEEVKSILTRTCPGFGN